MNIFDQYGIKEVADVTIYSIHKKKDGSGELYFVPALYLDTLKVSSVEKTAENVWAEGGLGNARLINWDYGKQLNVTLEDALCTPASLGMCWGGILGSDWKDGHIRHDLGISCNNDNPVEKISRMEKAFFTKSNLKKRSVSYFLPHTNEDRVNEEMGILLNSQVVDGTDVRGTGYVNNRIYNWKMQIESDIKSIAVVPDRFFDNKGRYFKIDQNRQVYVNNYMGIDSKFNIIYHIRPTYFLTGNAEENIIIDNLYTDDITMFERNIPVYWATDLCINIDNNDKYSALLKGRRMNFDVFSLGLLRDLVNTIRNTEALQDAEAPVTALLQTMTDYLLTSNKDEKVVMREINAAYNALAKVAKDNKSDLAIDVFAEFVQVLQATTVSDGSAITSVVAPTHEIQNTYAAYLKETESYNFELDDDKITQYYASLSAVKTAMDTAINTKDKTGEFNEDELVAYTQAVRTSYLALKALTLDDVLYATKNDFVLTHFENIFLSYDEDWYPVKNGEVNVEQFKGIDMWNRFDGINELIYFLLTKYEDNIIKIGLVEIQAIDTDPLYQKNQLTDSRYENRLWAYVNPKTMTPYPDDYWFHQGEPYYVKSLTFAPEGKKLKSQRITITAGQFPGMYMIVGETYIRSRDTGEDERMQLKIPLCKIKSNQNLTLEAAGDPTTFNLEVEVAKPASGIMMEINTYEIAEKKEINQFGGLDSVDGSTEVLSE